MKTDKNIKPRRVLKYFRQKSMAEKRRLIITFFSAIGTSITAVILPLYYAKIVDTIDVYAGGPRNIILDALMGVFWGIVILEGINFMFWRGVDFNIVKLELNVMKNIFQEAFDYLHKHSYRFFTNSFGGALVKKVNKLVYSYESVVDIFIFELSRIGVALPFIIVVVALQNIYLGLIFLVWLIIYCVAQYFMYKWYLPFNVAANIEDSKVTGVLADTITNNFNILSFASNKRERKFFDKTLGKWWLKYKKSWSAHISIHIVNTVLMLIFEFIVIFAAIKLWGNGLITTGTIVILQMYMFRVFDQMFRIGNVFKRLYKAFGESAEMLEILDTEHEIKDKANAKNIKISDGEIEFRRVGFSYVDSAIFKDFSLKIEAGEKVALVGHSGAGKTSIAKLLFRFFDIQSGEILIDGQNIAEVKQESLRSQLSIVPQDPVLFHRTLRENIAYGKPNATMEEIISAAKKAKCHKFITGLENGYDTLVGERGIKLSGGERQRVAIARAMLEDEKILVLDEATSSLDSESEKLIQEAMDELLKKKTAIIIAHRLSTIMKMDRIIVMEDGKIIEEGTHKDLLKKSSGIYKKLWEIQSGGFIE